MTYQDRAQFPTLKSILKMAAKGNFISLFSSFGACSVTSVSLRSPEYESESGYVSDACGGANSI